MKVAIPVWSGRVSPVFDVSRRLLMVDIDNGVEDSRSEISVDDMELTRRAKHIERLGVKVLICGAISRPLEMMLVSAGIQVIPQTCGPVDEILRTYISGELDDLTFLMPGCCGRRRQVRGRRGRRASGFRESR